MSQQIQEFLRRKTTLRESSITDITSQFKFVKTKRNQILETEGKICKNFYFVNKGCLRLFEIDKKGV